MFRAEDVSVVIPAYQHERFVGSALASVAAQTLAPRDVVVVDDGSRDRTAEIVASAGVPRLSLLRQENQGAHAALNRAIAAAGGRWVAILNSDDAFEPERLERALAVAREEDAALLVGRVRLIDADDAPLPPEHPVATWYAEALGQVARARSLAEGVREHNAAVTTSNFFLRRELWAALGGFRAYRWIHDYDFLRRALALCPERVAFEPELAEVRYRVHAGNTIAENPAGVAAERAAMKASEGPVRRAARTLRRARDRATLGYALAARDLPLPADPPPANDPPLRCGIVVDTLDRGGLETMVATLALQLPAHGIQPFVLCASSGGATAGRLARVGIPVGVAGGRPDRWRAWMEAAEPHILSTHFMPLAFHEAVRPLGVPAVEVVHNAYAWLGPADWASESAKQRLLAGNVFVSETAAAYHAARISERAATIAVVPNGARPERVCVPPRAFARAALGVVPHDRLLLSVGRIGAQKNQRALVSAFRSVLRAEPDALLVIVGDAPDPAYADALRADARDLLRSGRLRILPHVDEISTLLGAADAWVSSSVFEGWSVAAAEAACAGVPLVLTDVGGAREMVGAGERGALVPNPAGDPLTVGPADLGAANGPARERHEAELARAVLEVLDRFRDDAAREPIRAFARSTLTAEATVAGHARALWQVAVAAASTAVPGREVMAR